MLFCGWVWLSGGWGMMRKKPRIAFAHRRSPPPETGGREPDALIRLELIHYQFEEIRPFGDANGKNPEHPLSD